MFDPDPTRDYVHQHLKRLEEQRAQNDERPWEARDPLVPRGSRWRVTQFYVLMGLTFAVLLGYMLFKALFG